MKTRLMVLFVFSAFLMSMHRTYADPLYQVSVVQTAAKAINYRNLKGSVKIDFKGTVLLPQAKGIASINNKAGMTTIKAEFENLKSPGQFGAEYLTYVLWAVSPEGLAINLGELITDDGESGLMAVVPLQALSLIVTAEPYFAVTQPGNVVVLENAIKPGNKKKIELIDAKYELLEKGQYIKNISASELKPPAMDKKTPFAVYQARNAVKIARAAGAETYAADIFKNAEKLLALSETKMDGKKDRAMTAREAVQSAEGSRSIAVKRQMEGALRYEREQAHEQVASANTEAVNAIAGQARAENAQAKAEKEKGQSDKERVAALKLATSAEASSTASQSDAKEARDAADKSNDRAEIADERAKKAEAEKAGLRAQLLKQLNSILQTRDTARGLIVNMSDALFQTASSELEPSVREKLAKIAGIVGSHSGLKLDVEGHTDNVGSDEYNQDLSEKRARSVLNYLVSQGVLANSIVSRGFGKTSPVESNDTPAGRQNNRRVEMIVSGLSLGTPTEGR